MANQNRSGDWDDLGRTIGDIVDNAINSRNYRELNETICDALSKAVDEGGEALRRSMAGAFDAGSAAVKRAAQESRDRRKYVVEPKKAPAKPLPVLYASTTGRSAAGVLKTVFGSLVGFPSLIGSAVLGILGLAGIGPGFVSFPAILLAVLGVGGIGVFSGGVGSLTSLARFKHYTRMVGSATHINLEKLSRGVGKSVSFVRRDVQKMIDSGLFLEGHLDKEGTQLITSHETFQDYEASRLALEARQAELSRERRAQEEKQAKKAENAKLQEVLEKGNNFIREIHRCNDAIPGQEISAKIDRMESAVRKIFLRAEEHPEVIPDLKKLMDYYLPMTVKLLNAYAEMDALGVEGETVRASKQEIEDTLDTLNLAFEKLLDSIFKETALDISGDISVLQTLLSQEGLTDDGFDLH